jgi:hypothetical protein
MRKVLKEIYSLCEMSIATIVIFPLKITLNAVMMVMYILLAICAWLRAFEKCKINHEIVWKI